MCVCPEGVCPVGGRGCVLGGVCVQGSVCPVRHVCVSSGVCGGCTPPPPLDRILDTCLGKHYLSATTVVKI